MKVLEGAKSSRRSFIKGMGLGAASLAIGGLSMPALGQSKTLTIINDSNNDKQHAILKEFAATFEKNSGATVNLNFIDNEANKTAIRNYLTAGTPDVCFWYSGNRMKAFVNKGLFDDISDLVASKGYDKVLGGSLSAVTVDGKQYGLPTQGTLWGNFYLKDVFDKNGWTPPTTWDELLAFGEKTRAAGMDAFAFGSREMWPCAGFFDELNLRINGLDKHIALMDGKMSYLDDSLTSVFDHWEQLIKANIFTANHSSFNWQEAAALLSQRKAAMMNIGAFIKYGVTEADAPNLAFAPFPKIADIARYEDFSTDTVHIPANAQNKQLARDFLAFFYEPENLSRYVEVQGQIPGRSDVPPSKDPLVNAAIESLKTVSGTSQYYDRDTDPDMAQVGMNGFQEFMTHPERRGDILKTLEATRKRIFNT